MRSQLFDSNERGLVRSPVTKGGLPNNAVAALCMICAWLIDYPISCNDKALEGAERFVLMVPLVSWPARVKAKRA